MKLKQKIKYYELKKLSLEKISHVKHASSQVRGEKKDKNVAFQASGKKKKSIIKGIIKYILEFQKVGEGYRKHKKKFRRYIGYEKIE